MSEQIANDVLLDMHRRMVRIRIFEETAGQLMEDGKIPGALHLYVGEEAVGAGVMVHLSDEDWITSTHRGHGHLIAKGGEFKPMFAELFGRFHRLLQRQGRQHACLQYGGRHARRQRHRSGGPPLPWVRRSRINSAKPTV